MILSMAHQELSTFSKRLTILIGLSVVGAMAFGLAVSFYRNILFEETLKALSGRNKIFRQTIDQELEDLAYYRSVQYRDKYAKENLGKLNAGEKVLILTTPIPPIASGVPASADATEHRQAAYREYLQKIPILEHWLLYLFRSEELAELKRSF